MLQIYSVRIAYGLNIQLRRSSVQRQIERELFTLSGTTSRMVTKHLMPMLSLRNSSPRVQYVYPKEGRALGGKQQVILARCAMNRHFVSS